MHDLLDLELQTKTINGTLFPSNDFSIARQRPNDSADKVWGEWEIARIFPISSAEIIRLGKDPRTVAKLENDIWGLGDDAYSGAFDVFHQIHCLNTLRRIAYSKHYNLTLIDTAKPELSLQEIHVNHCVDILLQALQCSANVNLMTYNWVETQDLPQPDMFVAYSLLSYNNLY